MKTVSHFLVVAFVVAAASRCGAGERFPFVIPGDDASASATDLSSLSPRPAGGDGFVRIENGHFTTDAGRLKIWGVNTCFAANFPTHEDAAKVAAHLAKIGVNGVRLHHHDTQKAPSGIWGPVKDGERTLDPQQLDRQDYFLDQLHRHGIYANLNLHVGRTFTEEEGFVSVGLPREAQYNKYVLYFEPRMRTQFKKFCRAYLTHVNPYRKLSRAADPGIAMVEITNENSFSKFGPRVAEELPQPYRDEFQKQWNTWLAKRYSNTAALRKAWSARNEPLGDAIADSRRWGEQLGDWRVRESPGLPVKPKFGEPGPTEDVPAMRLEIGGKAGELSAQELQFPNVKVEPGRTYTLVFWIKGEAPREVFVDVSNQGPTLWNDIGYSEDLKVGSEWQRVQRVFRTSNSIPGKARVCFKFGGNDADFWLAGFSLRPGADPMILPEGQSLESANVSIPGGGWSEAAIGDARQFMADVETEFIREISEFLKTEIGVRVPITASQIDYHGAKIVADTCDYADIHAYWQHPHFPRRPWDPVDWTIANTPMELHPDGDALLSRTPWRLLDRPFTISEWNIPDPHDYAASVVPFAALVASLQDWDGVFFFDYQSSDRWYTDQMQRFFSFNGQPAKLALFTACAHMYRRGDLTPLQETTAGTPENRLPATLALSRRIGIDPKATTVPANREAVSKRLASPREQAVWDASDPKHAHVLVNTPATRAVWGLVGGQQFELGGLRIKVGEVERDYAVLVLTSLDGQPVESSRRLLLAAVGSTVNQDMVWNDARTSVGNQWGRGPTRVNGIEADIEFPGPITKVQALDGSGHPQGEVALERTGRVTRFSIGPQQRTLWYEISGQPAR